mgnify:FL=1
MEFLKLVDVKLNEAGYLVSTQTHKPVNNEAFVRAQNEAHLFVSIAKECKGKKFKADEVSVFANIVDKVKKSLSEEAIYEYETTPKKPDLSISDKIAAEGVAFAEFEGKQSKASKVNKLLAQFEAIRKTEQVGEYFEEGVVNLKKLYSIDDLVTAARIIVDIE